MPETITENDACYALEIVKAICSQVGPGLPGSRQERERAAIIARELESHLGAGNVFVEEFSLAPWAFLSAYPISALCILIAALLNISLGRLPGISTWLTTLASLTFSILAIVLFTLQFVLNYELLDRLFVKKQSVNVIGVLRKPGIQDVKRLLILSGHHDSAPENTWLRFLGYGFFFLTGTWLIGFIFMFAMSAIQLAGMITGSADILRIGTLGWVVFIYPILPTVIFGLFFNMDRKNGGTVPGAADNLSASALGVAMCRYLVKNPSCIPANTEIRIISFGSEEAGCRGARRYLERHLDELKSLDARLLNLETVAHPEITIFTSDVNGFVKNSPPMVQSVVAAAQHAGVPYSLKSAFLGVSNDSGPFSQVGLKALTLFPFKVPQQMVAFYHQKWDRPEVLNIEPLLNVLKLAVEWVRSGGEA